MSFFQKRIKTFRKYRRKRHRNSVRKKKGVKEERGQNIYTSQRRKS